MPDKIKVIRSGKFYVFLGRDFGANKTGQLNKQAAYANGRRSGETMLGSAQDKAQAQRDDAILNDLPF
jgi:hypothetical protein